ncbi:MAG: hypothetical protein Q4G70_09760 [Pseudomonadota bacterium]|nr:hypothetical protein [Pseudomonadota bacterium]
MKCKILFYTFLSFFIMPLSYATESTDPKNALSYEIYLFDAIKKFPEFRRKYKLQVEEDLDVYGWRKNSLTGGPGKAMNTGATGNVVIYEMCRAKYCDTQRLTIIYNPVTNQLWRRFKISEDDLSPSPPEEIKKLFK